MALRNKAILENENIKHYQIMRNDEPTKVKFLIHPEGKGFIEDGTPLAYFPELNHNWEGTTKTCYAHIGQHSPCHPDYAAECREAKPEEYKDLLEELTSIAGYDNLVILNKPVQDMEQAIKNIDWKDLREQKTTLLKLADFYNSLSIKSNIQGVISLIDTIQDFAVSDYGYSESEIFNI